MDKKHVCIDIGGINESLPHDFPVGDDGDAISTIEQIDGVWVAHNGEYATPVFFCPFCGQKLAEPPHREIVLTASRYGKRESHKYQTILEAVESALGDIEFNTAAPVSIVVDGQEIWSVTASSTSPRDYLVGLRKEFSNE